MSIYMINKGWETSAGTINDQIEYKIYNERVGHVEVTKLVGNQTLPARTLGDFFWLCLCVDSDGSNQSLTAVHVTGNNPANFVRPARDLVRVVGAWGCHAEGVVLQRQIQVNNIVMYSSRQSFIADWGEPGGGFGTNELWAAKAIDAAFPRGLCSAVYVRMEAKRKIGTGQVVGGVGFGICQVNSAGGHVIDGVPGGQSMSFEQAVKGLTRDDQTEVSSHGDWVRCVINPNTSLWYAYVNDESRGYIMFHGFELYPSHLVW